MSEAQPKASSKSGEIRAVRASQPPAKRSTLIHCPACNGRGVKATSLLDTCGWCRGLGLMDPMLLIMFERWLSISRHSGAP